jgi:hypothetical protein
MIHSGHARDQLRYRGISEQEVIEAIHTASWQAAELGQSGCRKVFPHRDYSIAGTAIQIRMFDDRLEVEKGPFFQQLLRLPTTPGCSLYVKAEVDRVVE